MFYTLLSSSAFSQDLRPEISRKWYMPDHIKLQFAGNIGFISGGPGYVSPNKTLETDIYFGFLPQKYGGDALVTLTAKTTYSPWHLPLKSQFYIAPFSLGFYMSYTFGPQFDSKLPAYYPKGYYWWTTSIRSGAHVGGKMGRTLKSLSKLKGLELYYELGTYDLIFISYVQNPRYIKPADILSLSIGLKIAF